MKKSERMSKTLDNDTILPLSDSKTRKRFFILLYLPVYMGSLCIKMTPAHHSFTFVHWQTKVCFGLKPMFSFLSFAFSFHSCFIQSVSLFQLSFLFLFFFISALICFFWFSFSLTDPEHHFPTLLATIFFPYHSHSVLICVCLWDSLIFSLSRMGWLCVPKAGCPTLALAKVNYGHTSKVERIFCVKSRYSRVVCSREEMNCHVS